MTCSNKRRRPVIKNLVSLTKAQLAYDLRPWVCLAISLYAFIALKSSPIALVCGVVLALSGLAMLYMRFGSNSRRMAKIKY